MNKLTIPAENHDLAALVQKNDRRFYTKWLVLTAVCLVPAVAFFKPAMNHYGIPVAILLLLGFVIFPFFACGGWDFLTDRDVVGTVEHMEFSVRLEMYRTSGAGVVKGTRKGYHTRSQGARQTNYCRVTVLTHEGSAKTLTLRLPGDSESFPLRVGDSIVKYHGLPFPAVVGCRTPLCTVCGSMDDDGKGECRACGCSLIVLPLD